MKRNCLFVIMLISCITGMAQTEEKIDTLTHSVQSSIPSSQSSNLNPQTSILIGYLSYDSALVSMPQYALVQAKMKKLQEAYEQELRRVEEEFNQKYEAFLDGQRDFPRTILLKRQNELQDLLQRNLEFKQKGKQDLLQAEQEAMAPLRKQLDSTLAEIANKHGFVLIVNTDSNACPFISPDFGEDILPKVIERLKK